MKRSEREPIDNDQNDNDPIRARRKKWQAKAIEHYLKGNNYQAVDELMRKEYNRKFGIPLVSKYIKDGIKEWRESKNDMISAHKEIELAKVNQLEVEYWNAWERSKQNYKNTSETKVKEDAKLLKTKQIKVDERASNGDPRFLEGIHRCVEMRIKLLGIEVPQIQINQTTSGGSNTTIIQRRVIFKTRETTTNQVLKTDDEG